MFAKCKPFMQVGNMLNFGAEFRQKWHCWKDLALRNNKSIRTIRLNQTIHKISDYFLNDITHK